MNVLSEKVLGGKQGALHLAILAVLLLVILPLCLDLFRLGLIGNM